MAEPIYKIHRVLKPASSGVTEASTGALNAILKFDHPASRHCVYNEYVALRIAQTLHIPTADGALTTVGDGLTYASLEVDSIGLSLPNMLKSQGRKVAAAYPSEAAALVAFDIFIGNWDRKQNIKASLHTPGVPIFRGFDHSHALLNIEDDPLRSIARLGSDDLIVKFHPFYLNISDTILNYWVDRIEALPHSLLDECCCYKRDFRSVNQERQNELAAALTTRQKRLRDIIEKHNHRILKDRQFPEVGREFMVTRNTGI